MERPTTNRSFNVSISITPGEFFDRLTILEIKCERLKYEKQAEALRQFRPLAESPSGQQLIYFRRSNPTIARLVSQLLSINSRLWDIENGIREADAAVFGGAGPAYMIEPAKYGDDPKVHGDLLHYVELARSVYVTNDERSRCKQAIDEFFNVQTTEVKEYTHYDKKQISS